MLKMSSEPETQEILAKFNKNGSAKRGSSQRSCEENMEHQYVSSSELTLGESNRMVLKEKSTPSRISNTQERQQKRQAFQQLYDNRNSMNFNGNSSRDHMHNQSGSFANFKELT